MLVTDIPGAVTWSATLWSYLESFFEIEAIEGALLLFEQRDGPRAEIDHLRRRLHRVRVAVLGRLRVLCEAGPPPEIMH
jgi:hypothetical protein